MIKIKFIEGYVVDNLENDVNLWIEQNYNLITILGIMHCKNDKGYITVMISYKEKEGEVNQ